MAEYWGWPEIEQRLGYRHNTLRRWIITRSLPIIRRPLPFRLRRAVRAPSVQRVYTNDAMILAWELSQSGQQRQERLARKEARARTRTGPTGIPRSTGPVVGPESP